MSIESRLSQINTCWQEVYNATDEVSRTVVVQAQWALLERYGNAASRYLLGVVHDADVAQELGQEFAVLFLQGAFHGANPAKGRFRDYLKGILRNLVRGHARRLRRSPTPISDKPIEPAVQDDADFDRDFHECWRRELLGRSWEALAKLEEETGQPYHTVLKLRADLPDASSDELARKLTEHWGRPVSSPAVRKSLQRSREKFAEFLLEELKGSLENPSPEDIRQELIELDLYEYCRALVERGEQLRDG